MLSFLLCLSALLWAEEIRLPEIQKAAPISYPVQALEQGLGATVRLRLLIDTDGRVLEAEILESTDAQFNDSAIATLLEYQFTPAYTAENEAVISQIEYRLTFEPKEVAVVSVRGIVREAGIRKALKGVRLLAYNSEGEEFVAISDENGAFQFLGLTDGKWLIAASKQGLGSKQESVQIDKGQRVEVDFFLVRDQKESALAADATIVVEAQAERSEVVVKKLSSEEIEILPGSSGDVVKAIQNLPGIARAPSGIGQLIIRGTAPEDSAFYFDGVPVSDVFHFAGLTTVVSPSNIESVNYLSGNYSVRYGRQLGGLVDIETPSAFPDREESFLSVDLYQSAAYVEKFILEDTIVSVSGRRSYADVILNPIFQSLGANFRTPRYYDFQTQAIHRFDNGGLLQGIFFLSDCVD